jgi:hypothetical protein
MQAPNPDSKYLLVDQQDAGRMLEQQKDLHLQQVLMYQVWK